MPVSRAQFLKSLGGSVAGLVTGTGLAVAAQALARRVALPREARPAPVPAETPILPILPFITCGSSEANWVAITFDDGPTPGVTERVLDELKERGLHATFFMIGKHAAAAPELVQRVLAEGHEIGNHTFNHLKLNLLPERQVDWEIQKTQETLAGILNDPPVWLRPPYGAFRKNQTALLAARQMGVALWSVDPRDWAQPGEAVIVDSILTQVKPGSIIVCHDLYRQTADCLGQVLDGLLAKNFEFTTVSTLVGQPSASAGQASLPDSLITPSS